VSEALALDVTDLGAQGQHRTLTVTRKGGRRATLPLPPLVAEAVDAQIQTLDGPRESGRCSPPRPAGDWTAVPRRGASRAWPSGRASAGDEPAPTPGSPPSRW